ncbi:MAG TPA: type VII secretion-associated serine protease mycosin [Mycobacterium sp.]|nr:type VII secretion-associated serine protease mycosin [Mycobacterium sp.]
MRLARVAAAAMLTAVSQCAAPPSAYAVSPPPIDNTRLPAPAPPAPPQPTVQREVCAVPAFDPERTATQLDGLDLPAVWPLTRGTGQRIAVIDTGVAPHRRLPGLVGGGDYVSIGDGTRDCDGHGTMVAGIIAATPDLGTDGFSGVAPEATVLAIRQSSTKFGTVSEPSRTGVGDVDTLAKAVRTAADLGASVINISSVACLPAAAEPDDRALGAALAYAVDVKNAVVVAAAGNTGDDEQCPAQDGETGWHNATVAVSPAWYDDYVLTVGSVDADGAPSAFTLAGPWVDVAAPGEAVLSLSPVGDATANTVGEQHGSEPIIGTGYAAPVVSGLAALIRSRFPSWTPRQVMDRIKASAHHPPGGRDGFVGAGVVDPLAAVSTDAPLPIGRQGPAAVAAPITPPPAPATEPAGRRAALTGAAALLTVLLLTLSGRAVTVRLRRLGRGEHVPGG